MKEHELGQKIIQDIKDYVNSLDKPDNKVYQDNDILIMSCFHKAMEIVEKRFASLPPIPKGLPSDEEIYKEAQHVATQVKIFPFNSVSFQYGAEWMRSIANKLECVSAYSKEELGFISEALCDYHMRQCDYLKEKKDPFSQKHLPILIKDLLDVYHKTHKLYNESIPTNAKIDKDE